MAEHPTEVLPEPAVLPEPSALAEVGDRDWSERRRVAVEAWKLGRETMAPRPQRPVPTSRLAARKAP